MGATPALKDLYTVDTRVVYPFIEAVINTLKGQCNCVAKVGKPSFKDINSEDRVNVLIQATLCNQTALASVTICCNNRFFFALMGRMHGTTYNKLSPEIEDGAKELMNILFNQAKKSLLEKGFAAIRSIPTIIFGDNILVRYLTRGQPMVLPFNTDIGHFSLEVSTQELSISDKV